MQSSRCDGYLYIYIFMTWKRVTKIDFKIKIKSKLGQTLKRSLEVEHFPRILKTNSLRVKSPLSSDL